VSTLDRYRCEEVFRRVDDFLDRELKPAEVPLVEKHLETCVACAREYAYEQAVLDIVREKLRRVAVPSDVRERITRRLVTDR
jgi:anti-sigma factor (TIGR02949 family)